jgi:capsular polysaccharide biosynthesis protein
MSLSRTVTEIPLTLYKTQQWFCDNKVNGDTDVKPEPLFRGNQLVDVQDINQQSFAHTIKLMTNWLALQVNQNGGCNYKYWPSRGEYATSDNAIRQWMATICLNRAAKMFNHDHLKNTATKNLGYNLNTMYVRQGELGYIWMKDSAKLGAAALAALAILESPMRSKALKQEYGLRALIGELSNSNGSFDTFYRPRERSDNQNFYSGEALLFLATQYHISRDPAELVRIQAAFSYYRQWHRANRNPAFIPWHTQAYYLVWKVTKDEDFKDFIFEMNDWLLPIQQWQSAEFADMQGRFYDPKRPFLGPPHASSTGVYLEGLIDAFKLAKALKENRRAEQYRLAILRGIRSIMQLQYKNELDCFYIKHTSRVLGGIRTTVYDNTLRIDNVQHALMAFFKIHAHFCEADYKQPDELLASYRYFNKMDYPVPLAVLRAEIMLNSGLWQANLSRQDNIKVQRETQTIFLRSGHKPVPMGISGNDIHPSRETNNAALYPNIMALLNDFATKVNGELSRATIVRLKPGGVVYPHIDEGDYYRYRDRYHIVIDSRDGSEMVSGNEKLTWREGEVWWFDNKAMHDAANPSDEYRVHIIFDILPEAQKPLVAQKIVKQKLLYTPTVVKDFKQTEQQTIVAANRLKLAVTQSNISDNSAFIRCYDTQAITIEKYQDVYLLGNKFVLVNQDFEVLESSLPTYQHKADPRWIDRKSAVIAQMFDNEIIEVTEPVAVIANSSWKNYWHWHLQCLPNIELLKQANLFDQVSLVVPPLNGWREKSLELLGISDNKVIKARNQIIKFKTLYRSSIVNKNDQALCDPFVHQLFTALKQSPLLSKPSGPAPRRLYVSRQDCPQRRRLVNERELTNALTALDFEIVTPGELSYEQQICRFKEAEIIIGCHGAGLTNIGFADSKATLIEIFPQYFLFDEKLAYYTLAASMNMRYLSYVSTELDSAVQIESVIDCQQRGLSGNFDWLINIDDFIGFITAQVVNQSSEVKYQCG